MTKFLFTYEEFLNEGKKITVKRKYTDKYPQKDVYLKAPVREQIISFVKEKGKVSHKELMEYINSINEKNGTSTDKSWLKKNSQYFKILQRKDEKIYKLSDLGERVHRTIKII